MYDYKLTVFFKDGKNKVEILLNDLYVFETFELWYLNSIRGIHKIIACTGETHYINRDEILHVIFKKVIGG
jgi:hypothetical protein